MDRFNEFLNIGESVYSSTSSRLLSVLLLLSPLSVAAQVSPALQRATVGVEHPSADEVVTGTVWLSLPGQATLEQSVSRMYDPKSPNYHHFFDWKALAPYLPTEDKVQAVKAELASNNLTVISSDPQNLSVSFQGSVIAFESAFHTTVELHTLANGKQVRAFTSAPSLSNSLSGLVQAVTGLGETVEEPAIVQPADPQTGKQIGTETMGVAANNATSANPVYCISAPQNILLTTPGQNLPAALYLASIYGAPLDGGNLSSTGKCAYTPAQFYAQTGLDKIYAAGYTGKGQTIAILEQIGSPTLASDLAAFDQLYGLPGADLQIVNLTNDPGPSTAASETTLDVEWAHAVAPDAKIVVIDVNKNNLRGGLAYVIENHIADVVSISYGASELTSTRDNMMAWNEELMLASILGINVNVCSQDYGDEVESEGAPDVDVPADSAYATSVGGLSIAYIPGTNRLYKTSWGTDMTLIGTENAPLATPQPIPHGANKFGGGGGTSTVFPVPGYQAALGGTGRHVPDVSDIADGFTGLRIVITDPSSCESAPCTEVAGGTSLATPVFAAKWALLNQLSGTSLGQAAPLISQYAGTPAIEDIVPHPEVAVLGGTLSSLGFQFFSAAQLASPQTSQPFVSALWQSSKSFSNGVAQGNDYVISFGTDSSLAVTPGYDAATGWGQLDIAAIFSSLGKISAVKSE